MAFFNKAGSITRQALCSKHVNWEISASSSLVFQAIRCMSAKVFVGGLSYSIDEPTLRDAFSKYGEVNEAKIIYDRETGNSRGFGFVSYNTSEEATSAIQALDGKDLNGRVVRVNLATERARNSGFGGGGYGGGGGGGYGGGGYGGGGYGGNSGYGGGGYGGNSGYGGGGYGGGNSGAGGGYGGGDSGAGGGYGGANNYGGSHGSEGSTGGGYDSGSNVGYGNNSQNLGVTGTEYTGGGAIGETGSGESKDDDYEPEDYADKRV